MKLKSHHSYVFVILLILQACQKSYKDNSNTAIEFIQEKNIKISPILSAKPPIIVEAGKPIIRKAESPTPYLVQ